MFNMSAKQYEAIKNMERYLNFAPEQEQDMFPTSKAFQDYFEHLQLEIKKQKK